MIISKARLISFLFLGLLSISTSPIIARSLGSSATVISFWRMFLASMFLWVYSYYNYNSIQNLSSVNKIRTCFSGILIGIHFILFYEAVKITTIANATFLGTLAPFFTLFFELSFMNRKYEKIIYFGMFVSLIGTIMLLIHNFDLSSQYTLGNIYAVLCSLSLSLSFLIAEKVREDESTIAYTRMLYFIAAVTVFFIGSFYVDTFIVTDKIEIMGFLFLALIPTILGHNIFYYCIKYTTPTIVATVPLGEPVIASVIAYFLFLEGISVNTIAGGILCLAGIFIILKYKTID